jgi:hypothetical protein
MAARIVEEGRGHGLVQVFPFQSHIEQLTIVEIVQTRDLAAASVQAPDSRQHTDDACGAECKRLLAGNEVEGMLGRAHVDAPFSGTKKPTALRGGHTQGQAGTVW